MKQPLVNGATHTLDVDSARSLLDVLRSELDRTGGSGGCTVQDLPSQTDIVLVDRKICRARGPAKCRLLQSHRPSAARFSLPQERGRGRCR